MEHRGTVTNISVRPLSQSVQLILFYLALLTCCIASQYARYGDQSFRYEGIERFFKHGSKGGIQPKYAEKLRKQLFALDNAKQPEDMSAPGWRLHALRGYLAGHWPVDVSGNWRLTLAFEDDDAILLDYQDYH